MAASEGFALARREFMYYVKTEAGLSPHTAKAYERDLDDLAAFLEREGVRSPREVEHHHLEAHVAYLHSKQSRDLGVKSVYRKIACIQSFFKFLTERHRYPKNPAKGLDRPKRGFTIPHFLSPDQTKRLVEAPNPDHGALWERDRAILELMYASGLRATELCTTRMNDYDSVALTLKVEGKGLKQRQAFVGVPAAQAIARWIAGPRAEIVQGDERKADHRLFVSCRGHPLERVALWGIVKKYAAVAGLHDVHPHTLRHSFATDLLRGGCDLRTVQEFLGHQCVETTQIYTHVDDRKRRVVAACHPRFSH
jgi:integrase/recombinase XerD